MATGHKLGDGPEVVTRVDQPHCETVYIYIYLTILQLHLSVGPSVTGF